jgi:hypothetical protein
MPDNRKKKSSKKATSARPLRQTTLVESISSPARPSASPLAKSSRAPPTPDRLKRTRDSSESSDIGAIRLGPATPAKQDANDQSHSLSSRIKRRRVIIESDSDEKEGQSSDSVSSVVVVPRKRRLRRLAEKPLDSSGEESRPSRRLALKEKDPESSSDDDDEVDKSRT